MLEFNYTQKI